MHFSTLIPALVLASSALAYPLDQDTGSVLAALAATPEASVESGTARQAEFGEECLDGGQPSCIGIRPGGQWREGAEANHPVKREKDTADDYNEGYDDGDKDGYENGLEDDKKQGKTPRATHEGEPEEDLNDQPPPCIDGVRIRGECIPRHDFNKMHWPEECRMQTVCYHEWKRMTSEAEEGADVGKRGAGPQCFENVCGCGPEGKWCNEVEKDILKSYAKDHGWKYGW